MPRAYVHVRQICWLSSIQNRLIMILMRHSCWKCGNLKISEIIDERLQLRTCVPRVATDYGQVLSQDPLRLSQIVYILKIIQLNDRLGILLLIS